MLFPDLCLFRLRRHRLVQDGPGVPRLLPPAEVPHAGKVPRPRRWPLPASTQGMSLHSHTGESGRIWPGLEAGGQLDIL